MKESRPVPTSWAAVPFVRGSIALHAAAALAAVALPSYWPLWLGAVALNHAIITGAGLWPRSSLLGPNWTRLPDAAAARMEVALTIDDGPDENVTPKVLDLLDRHDAKATFFCIGNNAGLHPGLCRQIVQRGHDVENHSQTHTHRFSLLGMRGIRAEISVAQKSIAGATGRYPEFFRAPAGLRNPFLQPVLASMGLQLAAWTRRGYDTVERDAGVVTGRLLKDLRAGDILLLHDGHAARTAAGQPLILEVLPVLLEAIRARGLHTVTLRQART